jgi:hypothetical protein
MHALKRTIGYLILLLLFSFITGCSGSGGDLVPIDDDLDIEPFIEYAEGADCIDIRNRLFVIDDEVVLWDRVGSCPDASYEIQLYGEDLDDLLCEIADSIDGPQMDIYDENYRDLFETIIDNIEEDNLGLDDSYLVEDVVF